MNSPFYFYSHQIDASLKMWEKMAQKSGGTYVYFEKITRFVLGFENSCPAKSIYSRA